MRQTHLSFHSLSLPFTPFHSFIILVFLLFAACGGGSEPREGITDDHGRVVDVPTAPQRVVSTSPAVTEIMFALGAQDLLVGRTDFCTYPAEAQDIPSIGGISNMNIERILSLKPDLIISGSMVERKITEKLDQMHKPIVCIVGEDRFDNLYINIKKIGHLVGKDREADSLVALLHARVDAFEVDTTQSRPSVYYVVGYGPGGNFTAGGNTFINDIIRMAGGRNIAEGIQGWSYSMEALMKEDPNYIIVRREDSAAFCSMQPYTSLSAVRHGRVIGIESSTIDLQVPRNIDAVLYLRERIKKNMTNGAAE